MTELYGLPAGATNIRVEGGMVFWDISATPAPDVIVTNQDAYKKQVGSFSAPLSHFGTTPPLENTPTPSEVMQPTPPLGSITNPIGGTIEQRIAQSSFEQSKYQGTPTEIGGIMQGIGTEPYTYSVAPSSALTIAMEPTITYPGGTPTKISGKEAELIMQNQTVNQMATGALAPRQTQSIDTQPKDITKNNFIVPSFLNTLVSGGYNPSSGTFTQFNFGSKPTVTLFGFSPMQFGSSSLTSTLYPSYMIKNMETKKDMFGKPIGMSMKDMGNQILLAYSEGKAINELKDITSNIYTSASTENIAAFNLQTLWSPRGMEYIASNVMTLAGIQPEESPEQIVKEQLSGAYMSTTGPEILGINKWVTQQYTGALLGTPTGILGTSMLTGAIAGGIVNEISMSSPEFATGMAKFGSTFSKPLNALYIGGVGLKTGMEYITGVSPEKIFAGVAGETIGYFGLKKGFEYGVQSGLPISIKTANIGEQSYTGLQIGGHPVIGMKEGEIVIGMPKFELTPEMFAEKAFKPVSSLETNIFNANAESVNLLKGEEAEYIQTQLSEATKLHGKETDIRGRLVVSQDAYKDYGKAQQVIEEWGVHWNKQLGFGGSGATFSQLPSSSLEERGIPIGDTDFIITSKLDLATQIRDDLIKRMANIGETLTFKSEDPFSLFTEKAHAFGGHTLDEVLTSYKGLEGGWGVAYGKPPVSLPTAADTPLKNVMSAGEQAARKGIDSMLQIRTVTPEYISSLRSAGISEDFIGTLKIGEVKALPEAYRALKDVTDYIILGKELGGETENLNALAKTWGITTKNLATGVTAEAYVPSISQNIISSGVSSPISASIAIPTNYLSPIYKTMTIGSFSPSISPFVSIPTSLFPSIKVSQSASITTSFSPSPSVSLGKIISPSFSSSKSPTISFSSVSSFSPSISSPSISSPSISSPSISSPSISSPSISSPSISSPSYPSYSPPSLPPFSPPSLPEGGGGLGLPSAMFRPRKRPTRYTASIVGEWTGLKIKKAPSMSLGGEIRGILAPRAKSGFPRPKNSVLLSKSKVFGLTKSGMFSRFNPNLKPPRVSGFKKSGRKFI